MSPRYIPGTNSSCCAFYRAKRNEFSKSRGSEDSRAGMSNPHPSPSPAAMVLLWPFPLGVTATERYVKGWGRIWDSVLESRRSRITSRPLEGLSLSIFCPEHPYSFAGTSATKQRCKICSKSFRRWRFGPAHQNTMQTGSVQLSSHPALVFALFWGPPSTTLLLHPALLQP